MTSTWLSPRLNVDQGRVLRTYYRFCVFSKDRSGADYKGYLKGCCKHYKVDIIVFWQVSNQPRNPSTWSRTWLDVGDSLSITRPTRNKGKKKRISYKFDTSLFQLRFSSLFVQLCWRRYRELITLERKECS